MNKSIWDKIAKIAERVKNGDRFWIIFPDDNSGKKKYLGRIASKDGRTVQFWNRKARQLEGFSIYELLHIFKAKIDFLKGSKK